MSVQMKLAAAIIAISISLGGCSAFAPRADPSSFYILGMQEGVSVDKRPAGHKADFTVGMGPIEWPGYLDRQQIATRTSTNRLSYSENDRWAAPLAEIFGRVLGQNMSQLLNPVQVIQFPWQSKDPPDYQVRIEVLQFEGNSNQQAWLTAGWSVIDTNKRILIDQRSQLNRRARSLSTEDFAKALSEILGDLSREIVNTLLSLHTPGKLNATD